jgi:predicted N-formylglutamate amidohydrolase
MKAEAERLGRTGVSLQSMARNGAGSSSATVGHENADGRGAFVIVCDHASNRFPPEFGFLGLSPEEREAHIAWDPGALGVSQHLSRLLDAPLVYGSVSRLIIDCNRDPGAPDAIVEKSVVSGIAIPGNAALPESERRRRITTVHQPFHRAIDELVEARLNAGRVTALIAVHSFTPVLGGVARPWEIGILFDQNHRLADLLIGGLKASGLNVGVNQPYSPADRVYYTLSRHAEARGLDCVMIEIRNDLIRTQSSEAGWAERIAGIISETTTASLEDHSTALRSDGRAARRA